MALFGRGYAPVAEQEIPKRLFEIEVVYGKDDVELHLTLATSKEESLRKFLGQWTSEREVMGFSVKPCTRYSSVVLGSRRY